MTSSGPVAQLYPSSGALATLIGQHDALRAMMDRCEAVAKHLDGHRDADPLVLERETKELRLAFDAHNRSSALRTGSCSSFSAASG